MAKTTTITLNPTQKRILSVISRQGSISLGALAVTLSANKPQEQSFEGWKREVEMECRLFALRGVVVTKQSSKKTVYHAGKHLKQWAPCSVARKKSMSPLTYKPIPALLLASTLILNGCAVMDSWLKPSDTQTAPANARKLPVYNADGWLPPERMEQFQVPGKGMVYRYCTDDCPEPTPKLQRIYASAPKGKPGRSAFMATYATDPIPMMAQTPDEVAQIQDNAHMEAVIAEAEAYLRDNPIPKTEPKAPSATASSAAVASKTDEQFSAVTAKLAEALNKANAGKPTSKQPNLKDVSPSDSKNQKAKLGKDGAVVESNAAQPVAMGFNKIEFVGKQEVLSETGRNSVRKIAEQSADFETIKIQGHAAYAADDEEAYRRASLGRALAVRAELIEAGVPREKIRILQPKIELTKQWPEERSVSVQLLQGDKSNVVASRFDLKKASSANG